MNPEKHSGYGIVSFILSCISMFSLIIIFIFTAKIETDNPGVLLDETSFEAMIIGLVMIIILFVSLVSFGFGIAGLLQSNRKKVFAILGTMFSIVIIIFLALSIVLGSSMDPNYTVVKL